MTTLGYDQPLYLLPFDHVRGRRGGNEKSEGKPRFRKSMKLHKKDNICN
jgi:hypothetical protein